MIDTTRRVVSSNAFAALFLPVLLALSACAATTPAPPMVGADRDAHNCLGSAGYVWCAREKACVRPWELAASQGMANTPRDVERYCSAAAR